MLAPAAAPAGGIDDFLLGMLDHAEGWARAHGLVATGFATGPIRFSLQTLGANYARQLTAAIGFARADVLPKASPPLRILAMDGAAGPGAPPGWNFPVTDTWHLQRLHERPALVCRYDPDWQTWRVLSRDRGLAVTWTADAAALPEWEAACPLRDILHWHSSDSDWMMMHAAGVGADGAGVLLAGAGGSGKSTTTAACVLAGMQTTGDDFVVVDPGKRHAHPIYDTIKLDEPALATLPDWQEAVANPGRPDDQKARLHVSVSRPAALARDGLALKAVLLPRVTGAPHSAIVPATAAEAMRALAPSTMFLMRGGQRASMAKITALLRVLPAFRLDLGCDPMEAAAAIAGFLARA
jgi:hypothetical protein